MEHMQTSLYEKLRNAGLKLDSHESDLYVKDSPEARAIIAQHRKDSGVNFMYEAFRSNTDGTAWLDIPFAFEPYWRAKEQKNAARNNPDSIKYKRAEPENS